MKALNIFTISAIFCLAMQAYGKSDNNIKVTVNPDGRMVSTLTGDEVRYFGTNYTLPFAHGYRAANALSVNIKDAIDKDVYHMSRMGLNAFRVHLWDAELADSVGNLLQNDHLDLLDYLIAQLEARGIDIILTAQTNFGNGYPEHNIDTGSFTYDYDKCAIHENPEAIKAQKKYISQLARHVNPYTGKSYVADSDIIAMEINNEPCHTSSIPQVKNYINTMAAALRKAGWGKPVFYNVSHNGEMVPAYYDADIQGTTYQWYPIGLVAGHERKGNFLPYVANYNIPFFNQKNFDKRAKMIYEFDPADMLEGYLYPAVARTFAENGFQWATQFAYDPIDLARFNTEYQTHYLNLAYTPQKALGMRIAAHAMKHVPVVKSNAATFNPMDTVFGDVTVSYRQNLALLNAPTEFVYTNSTAVDPIDINSLQHIAGYGSSPVVSYTGRGAYMLDKINDSGAWRLEVFPDILFSADPFSHPSLSREVGHLIDTVHPISISLPDLSNRFVARKIQPEVEAELLADGNTISVSPGVYILAPNVETLGNVDLKTPVGNILVDEYAEFPHTVVPTVVNHTPALAVEKGCPLKVFAEVIAPVLPDSLVIYPDNVSFWRDHNDLFIMRRVAPYTYEGVISADYLSDKSSFRYQIVLHGGDKEGGKPLATSTDLTFPGGVKGNPLDWDAQDGKYYEVIVREADAPVVLFNAMNGMDGMEISTIPDSWGRVQCGIKNNAPVGYDQLEVAARPGEEAIDVVLTKFIDPIMRSVSADNDKSKLAIRLGDSCSIDSLQLALVNRDGVTYSTFVKARPSEIVKVDIDSFAISSTLLVPAAYPVFLDRKVDIIGYNKPLDIHDVEKLQVVISFPAAEQQLSETIVGLWLE